MLSRVGKRATTGTGVSEAELSSWQPRGPSYSSPQVLRSGTCLYGLVFSE